MPSDTVYRTIRQYNKNPISEEDMKKLEEIAKDYSKVKNYVYQRYSGINSLSKIYPGYTVQNEMTKSGLRAEIGLPSVYFYLAVFEALSDIKTQWAQTKGCVLQNIGKNEHFSAEERHYLRYVLKVNNCFEAILTNQGVKLPETMEEQYTEIKQKIDAERLHSYLRRQVRKHKKKIHTDKAGGFSISEKAYRYDDHGIYIATKEKRKRLFIPLTDSNQYKKQLYICLHADENNIVIQVPMEIKVKEHEDYTKEVGLAVGMRNLFVTDEGHIYGTEYGEYQFKLNNYINRGVRCYRKNRNSNPGRKKYYAGKLRLETGLYTYINKEINQMLEMEKPRIVYIPKLPQTSKAGINKKINNSVNQWQRGYVRSKLKQKCREQSIALVEVFGKDISNECSRCGSMGEKEKGFFTCTSCGQHIEEKTNAAKNALKRGTTPATI